LFKNSTSESDMERNAGNFCYKIPTLPNANPNTLTNTCLHNVNLHYIHIHLINNSRDDTSVGEKQSFLFSQF